jgi:hypothetical protein
MPAEADTRPYRDPRRGIGSGAVVSWQAREAKSTPRTSNPSSELQMRNSVYLPRHLNSTPQIIMEVEAKEAEQKANTAIVRAAALGVDGRTGTRRRDFVDTALSALRGRHKDHVFRSKRSRLARGSAPTPHPVTLATVPRVVRTDLSDLPGGDRVSQRCVASKGRIATDTRLADRGRRTASADCGELSTDQAQTQLSVPEAFWFDLLLLVRES